jgi:hypothetical protein
MNAFVCFAKEMMMADRTPGRVIRQSISEDTAFHNLSLEAQVLYLMLRPHFNTWGKLKADPNLLKGTVVPLHRSFHPHSIARWLEEISEKTSVKLFQSNGMPYLHDLDWDNHQLIRKDRGKDMLPSHPLTEEGIVHNVSLTTMQLPPQADGDSARNRDGSVTESVCRGP